MNNLPPSISVTAPVSWALDRVKWMLFQPFDLGKWFVVGFCAWLAGLGESNYTFRFNERAGGGNFRESWQQTREYVMQNLAWILPLSVVVILAVMLLGLLVAWLNSRGKFLFLYCVALNRAEVKRPWQTLAREGNSLFWFQFVWGLIGLGLSVPLVIGLAMAIAQVFQRGAVSITEVLTVAGLGLALFSLFFAFVLVRKFTIDFVAPIMILRRASCAVAWREFLVLLFANVEHFVLYLLFQIVLTVAIGVVVILTILGTCCIAGCLMAIPYIGTVVLLPVLVFDRAYSLYYLAQFGPAYNLFPSPSQAADSPPGG
jgi:hypothetical protein